VSNHIIRTEDSFLPCEASAFFQQVRVRLKDIQERMVIWTHVLSGGRILEVDVRLLHRPSKPCMLVHKSHWNPQYAYYHCHCNAKAHSNAKHDADTLPPKLSPSEFLC
jgi:hypothetical protein